VEYNQARKHWQKSYSGIWRWHPHKFLTKGQLIKDICNISRFSVVIKYIYIFHVTNKYPPSHLLRLFLSFQPHLILYASKLMSYKLNIYIYICKCYIDIFQLYASFSSFLLIWPGGLNWNIVYFDCKQVREKNNK
jgi:hypothetical protein